MGTGGKQEWQMRRDRKSTGALALGIGGRYRSMARRSCRPGYIVQEEAQTGGGSCA